MSATEWSPGDVITDEGGCVFFVIEDADSRRAIDADGNDWYLNTIEDARPLVVLDPESDEDVQRLHRAVMRFDDPDLRTRDNLGWDDTQAALRELANPTPPRINEPGMWGVVEASCAHDSRRREWVRHIGGNWHATSGAPDDWDSLIDPALVREGVPE